MTEPPNTEAGYIERGGIPDYTGYKTPNTEARVEFLHAFIDGAEPGWDASVRHDAHAALDAIASELERREHVLELLDSGSKALAARNAELVAELERVRAELDERRAMYVKQTDRAEQAEARLDRAVEALREIAALERAANVAQNTASRALAEIEESE